MQWHLAQLHTHERNGMVVVIGFDGMNRAGKGTQIQLLAERFRKREVLVTVLRGDGSRPGLGLEEGDPPNTWWKNFRSSLAEAPNEAVRFALWDQAACRLVHELRTWKTETMPQRIAQAQVSYGAILLDRTLISRLLLVVDSGRPPIMEELYTASNIRPPIAWDEILPDLIIHLHGKQGVLTSRLDPSDPKYHFRRELLEEKYSVYLQVLASLPAPVRERVVEVDAGLSIPAVHQAACRAVDERLAYLLSPAVEH